MWRSLAALGAAGCLSGRGLSDDNQYPDPTLEPPTSPTEEDPASTAGNVGVLVQNDASCTEDAPGLTAEESGGSVYVLHAVPDLARNGHWTAAAVVDPDAGTVALSYSAPDTSSAPCTMLFDLTLTLGSGTWSIEWDSDPSVATTVTVP